jgi:chemosensory pili system protein ChpA (sensor histidine kinase/response regulator)
MDLSEPQERLFKVEHPAQVDTGLTDYELEVARRPMIRGALGADDLESYIQEAIVMSSENQGSDIYAGDASVPAAAVDGGGVSSGELMAIDYSRPVGMGAAGLADQVVDGVDILGLADDDDIGEKYLVIKRVTPGSDSGQQKSAAPVERAAEAAAATSASLAPDDTQTPLQSLSQLPDITAVEASQPAPVPVEAPLLRLVSTGAHAPVANDIISSTPEGFIGSEDHDEPVAPPPSQASNDVFGYIASVSPPADEEDFDNYLLNGNGFKQDDTGFDELALEAGDSMGGYDVSLADAIDYREYFDDFAGPDGDSQAAAEVRPEQGDALPGPDDAALAGFAGETIASPPLDDAGAVAWQPENADIDDIFSDFAELGTPAGSEAWLQPAATEARTDGEPAAAADIFAEDLFTDAVNLDAQAVAALPVADELAAAAAASGTVEGTAAVDLPVPETDAARAGLDPVRDDAAGYAAREHGVIATGEADGYGAGQAIGSSDPDAELPASDAPLQLVAQAEVTTVAASADTAGNDSCCIPAGITFAQASPGGGEIFSDFLDAFVEEGSSELEKLEDAIVLWEKDAASEAAFSVVTRILHTMKGIAKGVGLHFYGTLIHNFETLLSALPRPEPGAEGEYFRVINAWLDACVRGLDHIQDTRADITSELPQPAGGDPGAAQSIEGPAIADTARPTQVAVLEQAPEPVATRADPRAKQLSNKMADDGAKALAAQQSVRITSEKLDHLLNLSNQAQQLSVRTAQSVTRSKRASTEMQSRLASVRAHIAAIADRALRSVAAQGVQPGAPMDALEMDQYSELQEAANILREGVEDLADLVDFATRQNTQVEALLKQQTKVISSIGSSIRGARVVPVSRLIPGIRRLVRTVSADLGKNVSFKVLNELGTLDRDDYARCQTILDHMVRNALDHGIEGRDERLAAGKPAEGLVTIDIRKAGADSIITLADDGRGIDPGKMRESATRKQLDLDVGAMTDAEVVRLIFHKGFSTASSISQISGRGVGMDIVMSELQEMGGDIQIDSVPGRGTAFHIRVPSSVTVNGALLVSAGEQSYAIPLGGLIAVEQVPVADFFTAVQSNTRLSLAGMSCEPAYLATLCQSGHSLDAKTWQHHVPVIIAGSPERYMAIAIDDVEEALELVIRSLGPQFSTVPGVAGAATTAAGEAIVALDLNVLVASVGVDDQSGLHIDTPRDEGLLVMVVDDSRTQRMVATSQLETVGVETITAENGAVAIDLLNTADRLPDIILMDVEMPVKDGIQALREIRKSVRFGHVPVIMITSRTGLKHRAMAQAAGCNGYMGKPFNFRMLIGQINQLTGHRLQLV